MCFTRLRGTGAGKADAVERGQVAGSPRLEKDPPVRRHRKHPRRRRGAAAVEFAIVAIPLFLFIFASIEFGRAMMALGTMEEAARAGCRSAIVKGATSTTVGDEVDELMRSAGIANYEVKIEPLAYELADRWTPISVTVTAPYDEVSWLPMPMYLQKMTLSSSCTLPKECSLTN